MRNQDSQSGVALMMSVLILAAVTAIAFSLATIVFIELRASRDVVKSEPALYATLGVTEEAMFQYKRFVPKGELNVSGCEPAGLSVCDLNGVNLANPLPEVLNESEVPRVETIFPGETKIISMYNLVSGTCDSTCSWTPPIGKVTFELVPIGSIGSLNIKAKWRDTTNNTGTDLNLDLMETSDAIDWSPSIMSNRKYELQITNSTTNGFQLAMWSYDRNQLSVYKGFPYILANVLKIVANYSGLTRTYKVEIPQGTPSLAAGSVNVALASNGGTTSSSGDYAGFPASSVNNGITSGVGWGGSTGGWNSNDTSSVVSPNYVQIDFAGAKTIDKIDVYTLQNIWPPTSGADDPVTSSTSAGLYGISDFLIQYHNGSTWVTPPGGTITGNSLAWRSISFSPVIAGSVRVWVTADRQGYARIVELEAYGQ